MGANTPDSAAVQAVLGAEARRRQALLAADVVTLQAMLADALVYVHSTAASDSRQSYLSKLASGSLKYLALQFEDLQAREVGGCVLVTGRMAAQVSKDGQPKNVASLFMTVWACDADGAWRLHAHQGTPVPAS